MNTSSSQTQYPVPLSKELLESLDSVVGAALIGAFVSAIFYGITLLQTYLYFTRYYGQDSVYLYTLIIVLTILDTLTVVGNIHSTWFNVIQNFFNPLAVGLVATDWGLLTSSTITVVIDFLVQLFYIYRAYILAGRNIWIALSTIIFGLAGFIIGIIAVVIISIDEDTLTVSPQNGKIFHKGLPVPVVAASLVCFLIADTIISVTMIWCLLQGRQKELKKSNTLIRKLILYTVNTGVITTGMTLLTIITGEVWKNALYSIVFDDMLSKCYINSMLALLNAREHLRNIDPNVVSLSHVDTTAAGQYQGMSSTIIPSELVGDVPPNVVICRIPEKQESSSSTADQSKGETTSVLDLQPLS